MVREIVATYEYRRADGSLAFTKLRYEPKGFAYYQPNRRRVDGIKLPKLLYRLPELIAADPAATVFIVEGEKDVDALAALGLLATCNYDGGGRGKWLKRYGRYFRDRDVVIIPDNDRTGQWHAEEVARYLIGRARSVRVLVLPGLEPKGDVSDWLNNGGTVEKLQALADAVPQYCQRITLTRPYDDRFPGDWELRSSIERIVSMDLMPQEKFLLVLIKAQIEKPRPTQKTIARAMGLSTERTKKLLQSLHERGFISVKKHGRENVYSA